LKLVQTVVVRDEVDIIDAQIVYHLNAGVDFVLATDHDSRDGTTEILESYVRDGYLRLFRESGDLRESEWRTRMARLAATEYDADWVINTDADEFWMPRRGTLKDVFAAVPLRFGIIWALSRHFVPRPDDGTAFAERMTARVSSAAPINDPTSPYRPHAKAAHRGDPGIVVKFGSHMAHSPALEPLRDWYPADVLHFPFRTRDQYERKGVRRAHGDKPLGQYLRANEAREQGRVQGVFQALVVDNASLERGVECGSLTWDTRLRNIMRVIEGRGAGHASECLAMSDDVQAEVAAITEGSALREADLVRVQRRLDDLAARLAKVESHDSTRVGRTAGT
jgi:hypothetical protein